MKKQLSIIGGACVAVALCFSVQSCVQTEAENSQEQSVSLSEADLLVASFEYQAYIHFFKRQSLTIASNYDRLSPADKQRYNELLTAHRSDPSGDYLTEASQILRYDLESGFEKLEEFRSKIDFPEGITREDILRALERNKHSAVTTRNYMDPAERDLDGDGTPDKDNNRNGIPDALEGDTDGNRHPDWDNNGDFIPDNCYDDNDGDGRPDAWDTDRDHNGYADWDNDGNDIPDYWELSSEDKDGNGYRDLDNNGDGFPDYPGFPYMPPYYPPYWPGDVVVIEPGDPVRLLACQENCRDTYLSTGIVTLSELTEYLICMIVCDDLYAYKQWDYWNDDMDYDGIPDELDLDKDGDNIPDYLESGMDENHNGVPDDREKN